MKGSENTIGHEGIVTENSGKAVTVSISATSACGGCSAKESCNMLGTEIKLIEVKGRYNLKTGDTVKVMMQESMGFAALFFGYILPFFVLLTSLIVTLSEGMSELKAGLISIAFLLLYYSCIYVFRKRINDKFIFTIKE